MASGNDRPTPVSLARLRMAVRGMGDGCEVTILRSQRGSPWSDLVRPSTSLAQRSWPASEDCMVIVPDTGDAGGHSDRGWVLSTVGISDPPASRSNTRTVDWALARIQSGVLSKRRSLFKCGG